MVKVAGSERPVAEDQAILERSWGYVNTQIIKKKKKKKKKERKGKKKIIWITQVIYINDMIMVVMRKRRRMMGWHIPPTKGLLSSGKTGQVYKLFHNQLKYEYVRWEKTGRMKSEHVRNFKVVLNYWTINNMINTD